ncbi:hypothetical protein MNBD_UNCLBAC01-157 [hydrothermal vent metagenome]|uniref:Secretin/TonB short N-terminal domain-containing protein n=1 Tax=hydrothermal vent metagenome TaxID=652676 RepID=A0A3B1DFS1_9ZZZZ
MVKSLIMGGVFLGMLVSSGYAQQEGGAVEAVEVVSVAQEGDVSLDFQEADIRSVLKILSMKSGVNIVISPEVSGAVTIQLNNVPWKQALDVILQTYGYAHEQKNNVIMVTTVEDLKQRRENRALLAEQENLETKTFILNFAKATDIIVSLEKIKSERGSIDFDVRTNMLIVTDIVQRIELIAKIIKKLDKTTPQVLIEAKVIETVLSDTDKLGVDWTTKTSISGSARPITVPFKPGGESTTYFGPLTSPLSTSVNYGTLSFTDTQAVFEMLKTRTDTNILSNPKVITLDNQTAVINIGEERRFVTSVTSNTQTGQTQSATEKRKIGINFSVTPHVNNAGFVTLDVEPEVSEDTGKVDTVDGNAIPIIGIKTVKTSVMVKNGETLIIAGLIKSKEIETKKRVPFIGDIPVFGSLFRKSEKSIEKTDLLIFITPHIITPEVPETF